MSAWIGAGAAVAAALITVFVPRLFPPDDSGAKGGGTASPTASAQEDSASTDDETVDPATTAEGEPDAERSSPASGSERWRGSLALDSGPKDLDADPPVRVGYDDVGDVFLLDDDIGSWNDVVMSVWPGGPDDPPSYEDCASTVVTEGTDRHPLSEDMVLCVHTSEGNFARLTVTELPEGLDGHATFDAVVWDAEGAD